MIATTRAKPGSKVYAPLWVPLSYYAPAAKDAPADILRVEKEARRIAEARRRELRARSAK